ncbi:DNA (cytosine-5-)-methyltransferase [Candidatus Thorarchaeota archaeon]|nr:MAG: DNA (cytosine-5-)-methyltransferase [Candidatus Thorarchaeota archaeon]
MNLITSESLDWKISSERVLYNHVCAPLSELDLEVVRAVPSGGNWQDLPDTIIAKSARLTQIKKSGGRTTYYGRLNGDMPSYTVTTYFNRPGNGTFIHPTQDRLISLREAARLQSFPDAYRFMGSMTSQFKQIGNAVPPLLAKMLGMSIKRGRIVDLFCGAGGLSEGLMQAGHKILVASDWNVNMCKTYVSNHEQTKVVQVNMNERNHASDLIDLIETELRGRTLNLLAGGPPCQGFSTAGKWLPSDARNSLLFHTLDIISPLKPDTVLLENVPGIKSMQNGKILEEFINALESLGYITHVILLKAEEFGVPQQRRRIFIIANRNGHMINEPIGSLSSIVRGNKRHDTHPEMNGLPPPVTVQEAISDIPPIPSGGGTDIIDYDLSWTSTGYQQLMRGVISSDEFFANRAG